VTEPEMVEIEPGHTIKCHLTVEQLSQPVEISGDSLATLAD
jgi:peptide/nickel transport system ATP-binding protein